MLKIWGRHNSTNVKKVVWCAEELAIPYERTDAGGAFGVVDTPAYRSLNPNGLVPTIEDDGLVLWESNAIVRYLVAKHGAGSLWPVDPAARAVGDKWMDWATSTFAAAFRDLFWGMVRTPPGERNPDAIEASRTRSAALLATVDAALAKSPFLGGDAFGMGDIPLGCFAYAWFGMPIERPGLPNLEAWYRRLTERPAYRAGVMIPLT
jgi:glutathione S-transferase